MESRSINSQKRMRLYISNLLDIKCLVNKLRALLCGFRIMVLTQISRLRFKQSRISLLIPHIYVLDCFVNFSVIFTEVYLKINSFSERISKIYGNRKS